MSGLPAHPVWPLLARRVTAQMGLDFPPARMNDFKRAVAGAAAELGVADASACAVSLLAVPWTRVQTGILASHLTVGETYFFRDAPIMEEFALRILPSLIRERRAQGRRSLRIWSAGCCTGEEPYSLAMLVDQALPDRAEWAVAIVATDINPRFLERAREGRFAEWSFRGVTGGIKGRYFKRTPDGRFHISPHIRAMVRFAEFNLAREDWSAAVEAPGDNDVIFCRNLLMYFSDKQARALARRLQRVLGPGGWLAVSPSEARAACFPELAPVNSEAGVLFRKPSFIAPIEVRQAQPVPLPFELPAVAEIGYDAEPATEAEPPVASAESIAPREAACALADQGRLGEALDWCDRWIAQDKLDPMAHYVRGLVLIEQGAADDARRALRRCLYLHPGFPLAHLPQAGGLHAGRLRETLEIMAAAGART
jgi:chemotaxis protein methyltransferase CheR